MFSTGPKSCAVLLFAGVVGGLPASADTSKLPPPATEQIDFDHDVKPVLERCYVCHGPQQQMNGLRLDRPGDAERGGYSGPAIVLGKSAESRLIHLVAGLEKDVVMPPVGDRLTSTEISILRAWIDQGAHRPTSTEAKVASSESQVEAEEPPQGPPKSTHWSFQPLRRPEVPNVRDDSWARNAIDTFVLARLEAEGIKPSPEASRQTLMRRVSLDLIGLPPTPQQVAKFLADDRPDTYEQLVNGLLDSKHYGEKWAMHWLDLARYADSDGYEKDIVRPHAWRYRHWVVDALNRDMPFDQFTIEQIAGDLLPNAGIEQHVATGLHRNTLKNREGGVKLEQFRFEETVDRANTVGTVWLGLTVGCAQCHDHKYDPISQKDYYGFYAFFNNLEEPLIDAPLPGEMGPYLQKRSEYVAKRAALLEEYCVGPELMGPWEAKLILAADNPGKWTDWDIHYDGLEKMTDGGHKVLRMPRERRSERQQNVQIDFFLKAYGKVVGEEVYEGLGFKELIEKLSELKASYPQLAQARVVVENPQPRKTHLHVRGQWDRQGIEVTPRTPAVLPRPETNGKLTRLDLAKWLLSPENPLTARVTVNRIWQEYFGRGLVGTSENFGTQGEEPSHPQLLDWLAGEFIDNGWSFKKLHKLIVMSATYRQASDTRPELLKRDPSNTLLARQSRLRLPAELIRDSALGVSGLLYGAVGGPSVQLPLPEGVRDLLFQAGKFVDFADAEGKNLYRRGLYIHFQRSVPYPFLQNFDAPEASTAACRRERSNTPLQSLNLLNDPVFFEAAQGLAMRILQEAPGRDFADRLAYAYQLCLSRKPKTWEQESMSGYYTQQGQMLDNDAAAVASLFPAVLEGVDRQELAAWVGVSRILLNLDEFITRE